MLRRGIVMTGGGAALQKGAPRHRSGMMLRVQYERPILEGRKQWEGRAQRGLAAKVSRNDVVVFTVTGHGESGIMRTMSFRVQDVRKFDSCSSMIRSIGQSKLLPDFRGTFRQACSLYKGLVGGGHYVAWRIDRKSVRLDSRKLKKHHKKLVHWTLGRGMVERGVEQPHLDPRSEGILEKFGKALVSNGHRADQAEQHKDRLRYLGRVLKDHSIVPPSAQTEATRQQIKKLRKLKRASQTKSHLCCTFNWMVKYTQGQSLRPGSRIKREEPAAAAHPERQKRSRTA